MTDREQIIAGSFQAFAKIRRQDQDAIAAAWIGRDLEHAGQPGLTPDERRLVAACVSCGWWTPYDWQDGGGDDFDRLPSVADRIREAAGQGQQDNLFEG